MHEKMSQPFLMHAICYKPIQSWGIFMNRRSSWECCLVQALHRLLIVVVVVIVDHIVGKIDEQLGEAALSGSVVTEH